MIVGAVGSGKTSLIDGVLNELDVTAGTTSLCGRVALCQQQPWIQVALVTGGEVIFMRRPLYFISDSPYKKKQGSA